MNDRNNVSLLRRLVLEVNFYGKSLDFIGKTFSDNLISNQTYTDMLNAIMEKTHALEITADKFWK